ncbi:MAG: cyclic pyranopterin monophosphate synthase MoaC [Pyrobaculum sp.]
MIVDISKKPDVLRYAKASVEIDTTNCNTGAAIKAAANAFRYLPFLHPLSIFVNSYCRDKLYVEGGAEWQTGVEMDVLFGALVGAVASGATVIKNLAVDIKTKGAPVQIQKIEELQTPPVVRGGDLTAYAYGEMELRSKDLLNKPVEKGHPIYAAQTAAALNVKRLCEIIGPPCPSIQHFKIDIEIGEVVSSSVFIKSRDYSPLPEALFAVGVAFLTIWDMVKKWEKDVDGQYPYTKVRRISLIQV